MDLSPVALKREGIFAVPILHYNMECAAAVRMAIEEVKPTCIAVELPSTMQLQMLHAATRLPDISVVLGYNLQMDPIYFLAEPCDGAFEGLRTGLEKGIDCFCIDLDIDSYPLHHEPFPDLYSTQKIGLKNYFDAYSKIILSNEKFRSPLDQRRELFMAKKLKELSLSYERILFVGGMYHVENVLANIDRTHFPPQNDPKRDIVQVCTVTEESCREVMGECGWISLAYEEMRTLIPHPQFPPDRQRLIYQLYKKAGEKYTENMNIPFPGYHLRNIMKFARNFSLIKDRLLPDFVDMLTVAKACVDHNYAYEVWELASEYPHLKNVDNLEELDLSAEDMWGKSQLIRFHMREKGRKSWISQRNRRKDRSQFRFEPPGPFTICSYPPEDVRIENFGNFLKKRGTQVLCEEGMRTTPFNTSLEDGIDVRETIRHFAEKKLYVKVLGKPPGGVGSIVVIFDEDKPQEGEQYDEKFPWKTSWLGEHNQESDMAFFATPIAKNVVGPGISRCEYGGFMMTYPPRRLFDVWSDPDYQECRTKAEVLLMAAIDYSKEPLIAYVAATPPRQLFKSFARRYGKKVVYLPIGQLSPITLNKLRIFHVLDGHDRRLNADEFIE